MRTSDLLRSSIVSVILGSAFCAHASVVLSNIEPDSPNFEFNAPTIGQSVLTGNRPIALADVQFAQSSIFSSNASFGIYSRGADGSVGSLLFSDFHLSYDDQSRVTTARVTSAYTLQANAGYYFVLSSNSGQNVEWDYTSVTDYASQYGVALPSTRTSFDRVGSSTAYYNLADGPQRIQVDGRAGAPVPEPASCAALGVGAMGMLRRRKRA